MALYEAVAVILMGAIALLFVIRRTRVRTLTKITENRLQVWVTIASPLVVATVIVTGLFLLGIENLTGVTAAGRLPVDHSMAVQNLFFRH